MRGALALAVALAACGGPRASVVGPGFEEEVLGEASGVRVLALPRPTDGRVWLSLWIDAGTRDADPAQLAAVAAWTLDPRGRALPDGIELTVETTTDGLDEELSRWAEALGRREASAEAVERARVRLERSRLAHAGNDGRRADGLALSGLVGAPVDPIGQREDDARVRADAVRAFLRDHVGAGRLLLVAVGDVEPERLRERVARAFGGLPAAARGRPDRALAPSSTIRVAVGDRGAASVATAHPSVPAATGFAQRLVARLGADGDAASADVFPLGGAGISVVRVPSASDEGLRALVRRALELTEEPEMVAAPALPTGPADLAAWFGARWVASGAVADEGVPLAVGVVIAGGRGDALEANDPDVALREAAERRLSELVAAERVGPALEGSVGDARGSVTLANGARIVARREPAMRRTAVAVVFSGGASEEALAEHGVSALLARLRARRCEAIARAELGAELGALGIEVDPILRADAWGLVVVGPAERSAALAALAVRCAAGRGSDVHALEAVRPFALAAADEDLAALALALSPGAPGRVAPRGRRETIARLTPGQLARWSARSRVGARVAVSLVTPAPLEPLVRRVAREVAGWPAGVPAPSPTWESPSGVVAGAARPNGAGAWIAWVGEVEAEAAGAGAVLAQVVAERLGAAPELRVERRDAGYVGGRAWAAVRVDCAPEALDGLSSRVEPIPREALAVAARAQRGRARDALGWAGASPRALATRDALAPPNPTDAAEAARQLAARAPLYVISRPAPDR